LTLRLTKLVILFCFILAIFPLLNTTEENIETSILNLLEFESEDEVTYENQILYDIDQELNEYLLLTDIESEIVADLETVPFRQKLPVLIMLLVFCVSVIVYIFLAGKGANFYIRRIGGLEAIDESVGRATEMGKPILFVPGIGGLSEIQTLASLTILGKVAEKVAEYDTKLIVPVNDALVLSTARETVKAAYTLAGRPDAYRSDDIFFLTNDQFGYVAGVDGIIVREKPATNFLLGSFFAESLILAETGFANGAIQISGTAQAAQLPFFVAACDYTLIGEELFAASAYLSRDPQQLGSLKGQDFGKIVIISIIIIGVVCEMAGWTWFKAFLSFS
jgi:hypothetical protein